MNHSAECTCEESLCETLRAFSAQHPESVLYQTSLMSALLSGVYEGSTTIADLLKHGDFGLGTFNAVSYTHLIEAMMRYAESTFGGVDIVINNAGIQHVAPVEQFPVDKWNDIIAKMCIRDRSESQIQNYQISRPRQ